MSDEHRGTDGGDDHERGADSGPGRGDGTAPARGTVEVPETIRLPRLLDFYELQTAEHTRIHEFYANLREGRLSTTRCDDCGALLFPPRIVCPECQGESLSYVDLPEEGELFAFSTVRAGAPLGMAEDVPFVTGIVDLGEVRLSARIDGADYEDLAIGDPVALKIVDVEGPADHERVFFRFEPVDGA